MISITFGKLGSLNRNDRLRVVFILYIIFVALLLHNNIAYSEDTNKVTVRMFNVDDVATLYINGNLKYTAKWGHQGIEPNLVTIGHRPGDSGIIDITDDLTEGENELKFTLWNAPIPGGATLSIEIKRNDEVKFSDTFRKVDSTEGIKYENIVVVNKDGTLQPPSSGRLNQTEEQKAIVSGNSKISSIGGYNAGEVVKMGKFTGQPDYCVNSKSISKTNKYINYYGVDSIADSFWVIKGIGFGNSLGNIEFSDKSLIYKIKNENDWKDDLIKLYIKSPISFTYGKNMEIKIYAYINNQYVFAASKVIPVVGLINNRAYGQCTWYVANKRLIYQTTIPSPSAYSHKGVIDQNYAPEALDALSYIGKHVAIISSNVQKVEIINKDGSKDISYKFEVSEMNALCNEIENPIYDAEFIISVNKDGVKSIKKYIGSNAGRNYYATEYWR